MPPEGELTVVIKGVEVADKPHAPAHRPWWSKGGPVLGVVGIIASVVPITTGIWATIQKGKDIKLEELRLKHKMEMDFVDRVKEDARLRTLRLILATSDDQRLKDWATSEEQIISDAGHGFEAEIHRQETDYAIARRDLNAALDSKAEPAKIRDLKDAVQDRKDELDRLRAEKIARGRTEPLLVSPVVQRMDCESEFTKCDFTAPPNDKATLARCRAAKQDCLRRRPAVDVP